MEIAGKVVNILPLQTGQGKNGEWKKQDYIIETSHAQYPKKVCVSIWGDKIDQFKLRQGESVTLGVEVESREFNGKWYTDVKAWKVSRTTGSDNTVPEDIGSTTTFNEAGDDLEELPF